MACACREARPHLEVLEDPSGQLSIDDVLRSDVARRFAPVAGESDLNFGYSASTDWLRLRLVADAGAALPAPTAAAKGLSVEVDIAPALACLEAGMDDHIGKPVGAEPFYATLLRWLPRDARQRRGMPDSAG